MAAGFFGGVFGGGGNDAYGASGSGGSGTSRFGSAINNNSGKGPTNEVIKSVNGMRQRRLGGSDIVVSELGLGTQRHS